MAHRYRKYKHDEDYGSNFRKNYRYKYEDKYESSYLDGYTTSAFSYDESIKRQRLTSPQSRSEYGRQRHNEKENYRHTSPHEDYNGYLKQDNSVKKRSKQTKNDMQNVFYQFEIEKFKREGRKSRSPRRKAEYEDLFEVPEDEYDYDKYLARSRPKEKKQKRYINEIMSEDERNKSERPKHHSKKYNDYEIFAYEEPKLHEKVFRSREKNNGRSHSSSEIEIKTIDYPLLAFKDNNASQNTSKTSSVFYLPTVYCKNNKSKSQEKTKPRTQSCQPVENQVFAANVENNNIFSEENEKNKKNSINKAVSKLKTDESLISGDTKPKDDSNPKISIETQTEESLIFDRKSINNSSYKNTGSNIENTDIIYKPLIETKETKKFDSCKKHNALFAYQIDIDIEQMKTNVFESKIKPINKNVLESKIKPAKELCQIEYKHLKDPLQDNYPVIKDYIKVSDNSSIQMTPNITSSMSEESARNFRNKKNTISNKTDIIPKPRNYKRIDLRDTMINERSYRIISSVNEIVIKDLPENSLRSNECNSNRKNYNETVLKTLDFELNDEHDYREKQIKSQNPDNFLLTVDNSLKNDNEACHKQKIMKPQNIQIFRSIAVDSGFKNNDEPDYKENIIKPLNSDIFRSTVNSRIRNFMTQRSSITSKDKEQESTQIKNDSHENGNESITSFNRPIYAELSEDSRNKSESKKEDGEQEAENELNTPPEKPLIIKQRDDPLVGEQQEIVEEYKAETSNSNSPLNVRNNQLIIRDSRWDRQNKESTLTDSKVVAKESSRSDRPITVFPLMDRRNLSIIREFKLDKTNNVATLIDRKSKISIKQSPFLAEKSQSVMRESKIGRPSRISNANDTSKYFKENRANNTKVIRNSRLSKTGEQKNNILRSAYSRKKTIPREEAENPTTEKPKPKRDDRVSLLKNSQENILQNSERILSKKSTMKNKISKTKISELFSRGKILYKSEDDVEISRENLIHPSSKKASQYKNDFNKSRIIPSQESKDGFIKNTVSKLFSRSKQKLDKNAVGIPNKRKSLSINKVLRTEENGALSKDVTSIFRRQTPSQETLEQEKPKRIKISKLKVLQSQSNESITSKVSTSKGKSKIRGFVNRSKSNVVAEPQQTRKEPEIIPPFVSPVKASKEITIRSEQNQEFSNENYTMEAKPCECITHYVKQAKECGNFFLGTTLHQQVMDILKVI